MMIDLWTSVIFLPVHLGIQEYVIHRHHLPHHLSHRLVKKCLMNLSLVKKPFVEHTVMEVIPLPLYDDVVRPTLVFPVLTKGMV